MDYVMSGSLLPLAFFPIWFQNVSQYLPFQFLVYVPIKIALGQVVGVEVVKLLLIQAGWLIALYVAMLFLWKAAIKKFTGVGT